MYQPLYPARQQYQRLRGVDYRLLRWGQAGAQPLLLLHGWMDSAETFQFMLDAAPASLREYDVIAPDWRGFGLSSWAGEGYYFPDYLADLDALLAWLAPAGPVALLGHSMGGIVAGLYAGIRPERVGKLISLEGFGLPATQPEQAPARYRRWLDEQAAGASWRSLAGLEEIAARLQKTHAKLDGDQAAWLAAALTAGSDDGWRYRADPRHRWVNPVLYRQEEAMACWREVSADTLWLAGDEAKLLSWLGETPEQFALRRACIARLQYQVLPGCGHNLHHDAPALVAQRVADFLAQ